MTTIVRPMRWWDLPAVMALEAELFGDEAWTEAMYWSELAEADSRWYVVAEEDGVITGYAGLCVYPPDEAYVQTIGVTVSKQRQGLGQHLLDLLVDAAGRRGCRRLDLEVRVDNAAAIGLYERNGFTAVGRRRRYYQPSGVDAVVMRKALP
jgi:ribosomal-protein-alanine N-acetyltransferase